METTMSAAIAAAQGHGFIDRTKTCARAPTKAKALTDERQRMISHHCAGWCAIGTMPVESVSQ
jgi:hypothetical protein